MTFMPSLSCLLFFLYHPYIPSHKRSKTFWTEEPPFQNPRSATDESYLIWAIYVQYYARGSTARASNWCSGPKRSVAKHIISKKYVTYNYISEASKVLTVK